MHEAVLFSYSDILGVFGILNDICIMNIESYEPLLSVSLYPIMKCVDYTYPYRGKAGASCEQCQPPKLKMVVVVVGRGGGAFRPNYLVLTQQ